MTNRLTLIPSVLVACLGASAAHALSPALTNVARRGTLNAQIRAVTAAATTSTLGALEQRQFVDIMRHRIAHGPNADRYKRVLFEAIMRRESNHAIAAYNLTPDKVHPDFDTFLEQIGLRTLADLDSRLLKWSVLTEAARPRAPMALVHKLLERVHDLKGYKQEMDYIGFDDFALHFLDVWAQILPERGPVSPKSIQRLSVEIFGALSSLKVTIDDDIADEIRADFAKILTAHYGCGGPLTLVPQG